MQKRGGQAGEGPKEGHEDGQRAGEPALRRKAEGAGSFLVGEEKAWRELTAFQYLKGSYKEDGGFLFTRSHMEKTRGNG